ncbi:MAG: YIP1 family protein [Phenylobacterium sp.]|uniref:Yip1 family protein n=1 Tax=Phenylobacterium sp. TaxID=1871053 RepID=UPI001A63340E|nr:Yip1 family protein [Phenylobacterium sp.]MBL8773185.1 YIP1 family protein [Phenylobacterium sp.]
MTPRGAEMVARGLGILVRPGRTWARIAADPSAPRALLLGYAAPLALVPGACGVAGGLMFGFGIADVGVRMSPTGIVLSAVAGYMATLAAVVILSGLVALIAPRFGGEGGWPEATNLVVYAATASWLGGLARLVPGLELPVVILAGLYSLYALYLGLLSVMRIPQDRALTAFAVILIFTLALAFARAMLADWAAEAGGPLAVPYAPR